MSRRLVAFTPTGTAEGGYDGEMLDHAVANSLRALLGDVPAVDPIGPSTEGKPAADIGGLIEKLWALHGLAA